MADLRQLLQRYEKITKKLNELMIQYDTLSYQKGWVEYKKVKNKIGKVYRYYYYRWRDNNGRTHNVYIGSWNAAVYIINELKKARNLRKQIKMLKNELAEIRKLAKTLFS
ncbi:MAG: hypothetical protein ACTSSP_02730 [Candidatus Asgardarchaeia archaeon]